ncbi:MAG: hypothetical protein IJV83_02995 [Clostridia bacterium]|nr:hypothetical protein [Clostridia bacterium]
MAKRTVTLQSAFGEEMTFIEIASISCGESVFLLMKPTVCPEGMDEDEAVVFEVETVQGEERLTVVLDDEIIDVVFEEYYRMVADALEKGVEITDETEEVEESLIEESVAETEAVEEIAEETAEAVGEAVAEAEETQEEEEAAE